MTTFLEKPILVKDLKDLTFVVPRSVNVRKDGCFATSSGTTIQVFNKDGKRITICKGFRKLKDNPSVQPVALNDDWICGCASAANVEMFTRVFNFKGKEIGRLNHSADELLCMPNSKTKLALAGDHPPIQIYDVSRFKLLQNFVLPNQHKWCRSLEWINPRTIVAGTWHYGKLYILDVRSKRRHKYNKRSKPPSISTAPRKNISTKIISTSSLVSMKDHMLVQTGYYSNENGNISDTI